MDLDKNYYKIGEVAEIVGVTESTLRFWETVFPQCKPARTATNRRLYTPQQIDTLQAIYYLLRVKGMRIEAAQQQMQRNPEVVSRQQKIVEGLTSVRDELKMLLDSLEKRRP